MHLNFKLININFLKLVKLLIIGLPFFLITGPLLTEIVIIISSLAYFFYIIKHKRAFFENKQINITFLSFYILIILSSFFSSQIEISLFKSFFYIRFFLFFYFVISFFNEKDFDYFNKSLFLAVLFVSLDTLAQFIFGKDLFGFESGMNGLRYSGPFGNELIAGSYLKNFSIIAILYLFFNCKNFFKNSLIFIMPIYFLIIIFITGEKMALILFILSILFFYLANLKYFYKQIAFFTLFLIILFSLLYIFKINTFDRNTNKYEKLIYRYTSQFSSVVGFSENSKVPLVDTVHGVHLLTAYEIFKTYPITGSGIKSYRFICHDIETSAIIKYGVSKGRAKFNRCTTHPHNFIMEIISETGIIGLLGYLNLIIFFLIKTRKKNDSTLNMNFAYYVSYLIFIFPIATSGSFFNNYNSAIFWILSSFLYFSSTTKRKAI